MEVPSDYMLNVIKTFLDSKIDSVKEDLKYEINELKYEIREFNKQCNVNMKSHEKRIRSTEDFKLQIITISTIAGSISALLVSFLIKIT